MNARCIEHAQKANHDIAIAIYDQSGLLLSFTQLDGTAPAVGAVARWKALSSAYYRVPTATTAEWGIPNAPKIATIQGGLPILSPDGNPLGGIGVSGASSEFDEECAAVAQYFRLLLRHPHLLGPFRKNREILQMMPLVSANSVTS